MPDSLCLCWVLVTTTHYHHARMTAFAKAWAGPCAILELTDTDELRSLESQPRDAPYARRTLFPGLPSGQARGRRMGPAVRRVLDELRPNVVCINGWSIGGALETLQWCARRRVPAVVMSDSTALDKPRRAVEESVKRRILRLCSAALVAGTRHAEYLESLGFPRERIFLGYDAVDNDHFARGAGQARQATDQWRARLGMPPRYFLAVSRFGEKKNLPRLIEAYALYRRQAGTDAAALVILGDGPLRPQLEAAVAHLDLDGSVSMPGLASYNELPAWYALAECFIHASTVEQWGLVVNEAMASGLPVLVSERCGCASDLVQPGVNGFTFDPFQPERLAELMVSMAASSTDRAAMGRAGAEIVAAWGPGRFAEGLAAAARLALSSAPPPVPLSSRALLSALVRCA
ncbi:MAG: glycosyltransferase [Bryobacteraceae bacterium]